MLPEEKARIKIDKQLCEAGWDVVNRVDYIPNCSQAVREALMSGKTESDYLLFVNNNAIAVIEAKPEDNNLGNNVALQAEKYSKSPRNWYGLWFSNQIPLVYLANGNKIYFKNMLDPNSEYVELQKMHSPKQMLRIIGKKTEYGALPRIESKGLRECQYDAETNFENSLRNNKKRSLAILATGSGKTYLACLASYRLLNYTPVDRVLFLVDRNNLAKQTESEFSTFDRTENGMTLSSLYNIKRLKKNDDINGDVVISTIQKLFAVLTGNNLIDDDSDEEDDYIREDIAEPAIELGDNLLLPPDYFKFIIVDECHRSIYGKWKSVLDYFNSAIILGLTATPTPEAYAFFDNNIIEKYTYEDSIIDGVNVPFRIYDIGTDKTLNGGVIKNGKEIIEVTKKTNKAKKIVLSETVSYSKKDLDRTVYDRNQIRKVLEEYRDSIYTDLFPDREAKWEYIPKTLIFAKSDKHADEIVSAIKDVFGVKFFNNILPDNFTQKITYSAGDSTKLIKDFRNDKKFRIAVTVTLVATGTDVKPLEVVMFMADIKSDVLYTQMKGRGCRTINEDKLKEVTPNANYKDCFYIVDACQVTESEKNIPRISKTYNKKLSLVDLLEHLSHGEVSDENLSLLKDYCSSITHRYTHSALFRKHLDEFIDEFGFSPVFVAEKIKNALDNETLPAFNNPSEPNSERLLLIDILINNRKAKDKLLELKKGYFVFAPEDIPDKLIQKGFSLETCRTFIENFEKFLTEHKDSIEALRIIYNSDEKLITYSMLCELRDILIAENRQYMPYFIWKNYKRLDNNDCVGELDQKRNVNALTNLIQIARYAFGKKDKLISLHGLFAQRFNLYVGNSNHKLNDKQIDIMKRIAEYIVDEGTISSNELNSIDTDLWRSGVSAFGPATFMAEMQMLSKYVIGVA